MGSKRIEPVYGAKCRRLHASVREASYRRPELIFGRNATEKEKQKQTESLSDFTWLESPDNEEK